MMSLIEKHENVWSLCCPLVKEDLDNILSLGSLDISFLDNVSIYRSLFRMAHPHLLWLQQS
jgi:hypothetical protein